MVKKIIIGLLALGILGGVYGYFEYNKEHRDIAAEEASVQVAAVDLFQSYSDDEVAANAVYLDKVVEVSGEVTEVITDQGSEMIVLKTSDDFFGVDIYFIDFLAVANIEAGSQVKIKGYCAGGDEMGVKMVKCSIVN